MVDQLFQELAALSAVEAIALGGSRAGTDFDAASDYDVYLYCTGPIPESVRSQILSKYCRTMEIGNHFWEYEDNCTLNSGVDLDLLYRDLDAFCRDVASVVEEHQARNGYTTCMWHNLRTCKVLYDEAGRLTALKQRFDVPYPEQLRDNILDRSWKLLHEAMPAYALQIQKAVKRRDLVSVNHRTAAFLEAYFDFLFALNRQTHPGEKRLMQLAKAQCAVLPERFEENLNALFAHMFTKPDAVPEDLERILEALAKIRVTIPSQPETIK